MAATFTPPTHTEYFAPPDGDRLWRRVPYQRGNAVIITDLTVTPTGPDGAQVVDGDTRKNADHYFGDGQSYEVDTDVQVLLTDAGYSGYSGAFQNEDWLVIWL